MTFSALGDDSRKFFDDWYKQPGKHTIFSEKLDWLSESNAETLRILGRQDVTIYTSEAHVNSANANALRKNGATVSPYKCGANSRFIISMREYNNHESCIVRHKDEDDQGNNTMTIYKISSKVDIELVRDFIANNKHAEMGATAR